MDLDGALLLQLVDLLLEFTLSLDGLVLLLQHQSQRVHLRAGIFIDFLCGTEKQKKGTYEKNRKICVAMFYIFSTISLTSYHQVEGLMSR